VRSLPLVVGEAPARDDPWPAGAVEA